MSAERAGDDAPMRLPGSRDLPRAPSECMLLNQVVRRMSLSLDTRITQLRDELRDVQLTTDARFDRRDAELDAFLAEVRAFMAQVRAWSE